MGLRGFLDNARREAASLAAGAFPGYQAVAQQVVDDAGHLLGSKKVKSFGLDDLGRTAAQEFTRSTPLLPLLKGDFREAGHRFYERPITGTLDFLGAGSFANQGLKLTSLIPGQIGESSLKLRGFDKLNADSLGNATNIGSMPSQINLADGTQVPGREYLLRPQIELNNGNIWARRTMRSPQSSGNPVFDASVQVGDTLASDPLVDQSVARARYEPFAKLGDLMNFGPKLGSTRFGKRLAIRNRSRLKMSSNEMMSLAGRMKKHWRKNGFTDEVIGYAILLKSMGIDSWDELPRVLERLQQPSGRKAILNGKEVDLQSTDGNRVDLTKAELEMAERFVKERDTMAQNLAGRIRALNDRGYTVVATGGKHDVILEPDAVAAEKDSIYKLIGNGNLHIKRMDPVREPKHVGDQGQLFTQHGQPRHTPSDEGVEALRGNSDQGRLFSERPETKFIDGAVRYQDPSGEWVDRASQQRAYPHKLDPTEGMSEEQLKFLEAIRRGDTDPENWPEDLDEMFDTEAAYDLIEPALDWDETGRQAIEPSDYVKSKTRASDEELELFRESSAPIKEFVDEQIPTLPQPLQADDLNALLDTARGMYHQFAPELAERIGRHGVDAEFYRHMVDSIRGFDHEVPDAWRGPIELEEIEVDVGDIPPTPPHRGELEDVDEPDELKKLRAETAEDYSRAAWYKNYLDNLVVARNSTGPDISNRLADIAANDKVREALESPLFQDEILPAHKAMVAAQLEADQARLGPNALSNAAIVRNNDRLAMLAGKEGNGLFFVARKPRTRSKSKYDTGDRQVEVIDENNPGDPAELIAKGELDTNPTAHLANYLQRKHQAANQELVDSVADASVVVTKDQAKSYINEGAAAAEDDFLKPGGRKASFVIIRPNGHLFKQIEAAQPLANQASRRLAEDGYHVEASNIKRAADEMFQASEDGEFSLGDMIRNPKLRGELNDSHYMVPADMYEAVVREVSDATNALSSFLQATSTEFKYGVLHGRWPAWVVNNTIGSQIYLAMTGGLGATIPHVGGGKMVKEFFPDVVESGSREMATGAEDLGRVAQTRYDKFLDSKVGQVRQHVVDVMSDWNQKIADEPARLVRLQQVVEERFQEAQTLAKARGLEIPDTLESRRKLLMDQHVREDIAREVLDDMIDFSSLSKWERMWWSNIFPFYTFIKGSTKSAIRTMADHPGRAWAPAQLAAFGSERTDENFPGGTPTYLRALLPVGDNQVMQVGGFNPYGQQSQLFNMMMSYSNAQRPTGQEHPLSMVNPVITIPWEATTNRDIYTDYPLSGNLVKNVAGSIEESVPLWEFLKTVTMGKDPSGREAFPPSRQNALLNYAGIPIRDLNGANLSTRMSADENRRAKNGVYDYWRFHDGV